MRNLKVHSLSQRLQATAQRAGAAGADAELQAHLAKYLCVLIAGFLEASLRELFGSYAKRTANPNVAAYVASQLQRFRNPDKEKFLQLHQSFAFSWQGRFEAYLVDQGRGDAIASLMSNRHLIAHGRESECGVSLVRVTEWQKKALEVIEFVDTNVS